MYNNLHERQYQICWLETKFLNVFKFLFLLIRHLHNRHIRYAQLSRDICNWKRAQIVEKESKVHLKMLLHFGGQLRQSHCFYATHTNTNTRENGKRSKGNNRVFGPQLISSHWFARENRLDNEARLHIVVYIYAARHKSSFNSHSEWDIVGTCWYLFFLSFSLFFFPFSLATVRHG